MMNVKGHVFEAGCEPMEVTSLRRPDTSWRFTDANGHEHCWYTDGQPATHHDHRKRYNVPSVVWVKDGVGYYPDGEEYEIGHHECRQCGANVEPGYTADATRCYIPGLRWFAIDGEPVTEEEFRRRLEDAQQQQ